MPADWYLNPNQFYHFNLIKTRVKRMTSAMAATSEFEPQILAELEAFTSGVDGWCTPNKAAALYQIASLFPAAKAFRDKKSGLFFGIEPWSNSIAIETATNSVNDDWWSKIDFPAIKTQFLTNVLRLGLQNHIAVIESASDAAFRLFDSDRYRGKIDLLHIDGSHSTQEALHDVTNWVKLVRPNGYVVLDDINWPSVGLAYEYLKLLGNEIHMYNDPALGHFSVVKLK
jgi:hypothetical protein